MSATFPESNHSAVVPPSHCGVESFMPVSVSDTAQEASKPGQLRFCGELHSSSAVSPPALVPLCFIDHGAGPRASLGSDLAIWQL